MVKKYSLETKQAAVKEYMETGKAPAVAQKYNITIKTLYDWKYRLCFKQTQSSIHPNDIKALKQKLEDAELENQVLRELLKKTYQVMKIE